MQQLPAFAASLVLGTLVSAGCAHDSIVEEYEPSVAGTVSLADGVSGDGYRVLVAQAVPDGISGLAYGSELDFSGTWPVEYSVPGGFGGGYSTDYVIRAWLTTGTPYDGTDRFHPPAGAPYGEVTVPVDCSDNRCFDLIVDVDLELSIH